MTAETPSAFSEELADRLEGLSAPERRAAFLGLLQEALPEGSEAMLVGGGLVELLTEGQYVTGDLDLVGDPDAIWLLLEDAGFERTGRHFVNEDLGVAVEVVGRHLDPSQRSERIRWRDHTILTLSLEDLIVDRLCAAKFWDSVTDREQAQLLYAPHRDHLDEGRLRARAEEEMVDDLLGDLSVGAERST